MRMVSKEPDPINIQREIARYYKRYQRIGSYRGNAGNTNGLQSARYDPLLIVENQYGSLRTVDRAMNRYISCNTLRRVSTKCWIIQACILNIQKKVKPFLKPATDRNMRGFLVLHNGEEITQGSGKKSAVREKIENFLVNTGLVADPNREDTLTRYGTKLIRDILEIDQVATEIQYTRAGEPCAFWAVDSSTIERVVPGQENPENIAYVQVIDHIPYAFYTQNELLFDFQNPRTDIQYSFYGYSYVEQAIDLVTSVINAFTYNSGFFTESKLPRGMLLIDGQSTQETINEIEEYLGEVMSGTSGQWKIPILSSGVKKGEGSGGIRWQSLAGTNKDMEFQGWIDFLISGVASIFSCSLEDLSIHSQKSQPVWENSKEPELRSTKSLILGDILSFLQSYINRIIQKLDPAYTIEFVGYERDDPKQILDLDKGEVETYKTLNEKREEKGLKKLEQPWADIPLNPHAVQLYQGAQGGGGMEDLEGDDNEAGYEAAGEEAGDDFEGMEPQGSGWDDIEQRGEPVNKSLRFSARRKADRVRVII